MTERDDRRRCYGWGLPREELTPAQLARRQKRAKKHAEYKKAKRAAIPVDVDLSGLDGCGDAACCPLQWDDYGGRPVTGGASPTAPPVGSPLATAETILTESRAVRRASEAERQVKVLVTELERERDRAALMAHLTGAELPPVRRYELNSGKREATAWALLSDLHPETRVRPGDTPTGNAFNLAIAEFRLARVFAAIAWCVKAHGDDFTLKNLQLWLGGDFITNHLHPENVETAQLGPAPAALWIQARIIAGIRYLLDRTDLERIDCNCCVGNHGRTTLTMRSTTATDHSWEWLIYNAIAAHFRDEPRVRVHAPPATHAYSKVYDFDLHWHHGHDVRFGGGVGGITIPFNKAVDAWNRAKLCHYHFFGHYHQYIDLGNYTVNGSLIGFDGYAMQIKARPEPAVQAFGLLDSKHGKCWTTPLWAENRAKEALLWTE